LWIPAKDNCNHSMKEYHGFNEKYLFCEKCEKKSWTI
jgi:hypothetical protein